MTNARKQMFILEDEDREAIEIIRRRWGAGSDAHAVRMALRLMAGSDLTVKARIIGSEEDQPASSKKLGNQGR